MVAVSALNKDTSLVIGMYHENFSTLFCLPARLAEAFLPDRTQTNIHAHVTAHLFDKGDLIAVQCYFPVFFAAGTALPTLVKNSVERFRLKIRFHVSAFNRYSSDFSGDDPEV
jgi:hypothetical protein